MYKRQHTHTHTHLNEFNLNILRFLRNLTGFKREQFDSIQEPQISNRPLWFISLSLSDNQSEPTTKFCNSFKADVWGNVLILTYSVLRFERSESFWIPADFVKFPVSSVR